MTLEFVKQYPEETLIANLMWYSNATKDEYKQLKWLTHNKQYEQFYIKVKEIFERDEKAVLERFNR